MIVYLKKKGLILTPSKIIGHGGEADIFDIGNDIVVKIFKQPNHPDLQNAKTEQDTARLKLVEHQKKLPAFPKNLPSRVVSPIDLVTNKSSVILGYSMEFLRGFEVLLKYGSRSYREAGISNKLVIDTFKDLHSTVDGIHKAGAVIGDFNDLNIMVSNGEAYIIDSDSFQFGSFLCRVFTEKFVDPLICDTSQQRCVPIMQHNVQSDWYAFAIMLMQSLLFVGPYGGVYKPKDKSKRVVHSARPLSRVTIFNSEVKYPKPAIRYEVLPDDLVHYFHQVFQEDVRGIFPRRLLDQIVWTNCSKCGTKHAKSVCPSCMYYSPTSVIETVRENVTAKRVFTTSGVIVFADIQNNKLKYVYHEGGKFKREDDTEVLKGSIRPTMRFRIVGDATVVGEKGRLLVVSSSSSPSVVAVDSIGLLPLFDTNEHHIYWVDDGRLIRDDKLGTKYIGDVLADNTLFWVGANFGFGFYRAAGLNIGFIFDINRKGINDSIRLPPIIGQIVDATCFFTERYIWFLSSIREKGVTTNRCMVIESNGTIISSAETRNGDNSWLGNIRGKCVAGNFLLSSTDDGIYKVEPSGKSIAVTKEFPNTEPFVDSGCHLFAGKSELYVVSLNEIKTLSIS
jgi:H/ACA ribonucleoprotein complex subunit 3